MTADPTPQVPPARILVVEDHDDNRNLIRMVLERDQYIVTDAADGRVAKKLLSENEFDLVITDMLMPEIDGLELLGFIRGLPYRPIVIPMSGGGHYLSATSTLQVAQRMGAGAPLHKPFTPSELSRAVKQALQRT